MSLLTFQLEPLELARAEVPRNPKDIDPALLIDVEMYAEAWSAATDAANKRVLRAGYSDMVSLMKEDQSLNLAEPRVAAFLEGQVGNRITTIAESRRGEVAGVLARVTEANGTIDDLERALREHFDSNSRFWATRIARTESGALYSQAGIWSMKDAGVALKEWLTARDGLVRDTHVEADGQRQPVDGEFHVGDASGPGPGMMSTAEESINCRCTPIPVMDGDDQFLERAQVWRAFDERLTAAELLLARTWLGLFEDMGNEAMRRLGGS